MTLAKLIDTLKMLALKHPNINSAYEGNIYDILNANPENKYASVILTQQSHTTDTTYDHYGFVIFYVDRLVDDLEENRIQIQSIGKSMLSNIITAFCDNFDAECNNISFQPFTQRFADMTAGVYCTITIDIVKDAFCAEEYWNESWVAPIVSIRNQNKSIVFTENGSYTIDYDAANYTGLGVVDVRVEIPFDDIRDNAYSEGFNNGREDGYNSGLNDGYGQGKVDGINEQKSKLETIDITYNGTYTKEDGYNTINVNVVPKVKVAEVGIKFAQSSFEKVPEWVDFEGVSDLGYMFYYCANLKEIPEINGEITEMQYAFHSNKIENLPMLNISKCKNFESTFRSCSNLSTIPLLDFSNATLLYYTFGDCKSLLTIPPMDTQKVTNMSRMFYNCTNLQSLPELDCTSVTGITYYFYNEIPNLVDVGGWKNLKCDWNDNYGLVKVPNLTYESCINILNGLYDFRGNGDTSTTRTLKVHQNFLDTVGDEISIGVLKGWQISV